MWPRNTRLAMLTCHRLAFIACSSRRRGRGLCSAVYRPERRQPFPLEMQEQLISSTSSSEDENDGHQLTINEHYAKAFQYRKEREELAKRAHLHSFSSMVVQSY